MKAQIQISEETLKRKIVKSYLIFMPLVRIIVFLIAIYNFSLGNFRGFTEYLVLTLLTSGFYKIIKKLNSNNKMSVIQFMGKVNLTMIYCYACIYVQNDIEGFFVSFAMINVIGVILGHFFVVKLNFQLFSYLLSNSIFAFKIYQSKMTWIGNKTFFIIFCTVSLTSYFIRINYRKQINYEYRKRLLLEKEAFQELKINQLDMTCIIKEDFVYNMNEKMSNFTENSDIFSILKQSNYRMHGDKSENTNIYDEIIKHSYQKTKKLRHFGVISVNNRNTNKCQYCELYGQNIIYQGEQMLLLNLRNITWSILKERKIIENKYKTLFIRSFNHEIRHPVTNIQQLLDSAISAVLNWNDTNNIDTTQILEKLQLLSQESSYLLNLSKQITDITEIQSSTFRLKPQEFNLRKLVKESFDIIRLPAGRKGLQLKTEIEVSEDNILADKQRIKQLLQNLLTNAVKYTKNGMITIRITQSKQLSDAFDESEEVLQFMNTKKKKLKFQVIDTGIGISPENQQSLFVLFSSTNQQLINLERPKGIGLGLFLSQQLAQQLGKSKLRVKTGSHGTTFTFYVIVSTNKLYPSSLTSLYTDEVLLKNSPQTKPIPRYFVQESFELIDRKEFIKIKKQASLNNKTLKVSKQCNCIQILIVDDSELICQLLKEVLQNFRTSEAKDGVEALRAVRRQMLNECCQIFQLITMDCEMPLMDGWTATKRIRKLGYNGPILGHTAYASYQDIQRCIQAGMNEVLVKPSKSYEILSMVELMRNVATTVIPQISPQSMSRIKTFSKFMKKKMTHNFSPQCRLMIRKPNRNKTEIVQHQRHLCPECAKLRESKTHIQQNLLRLIIFFILKLFCLCSKCFNKYSSKIGTKLLGQIQIEKQNKFYNCFNQKTQ